MCEGVSKMEIQDLYPQSQGASYTLKECNKWNVDFIWAWRLEPTGKWHHQEALHSTCEKVPYGCTCLCPDAARVWDFKRLLLLWFHNCNKQKLMRKNRMHNGFQFVACHQVVCCSSNESATCWRRDENSSNNHLKLLLCYICGKEYPNYMPRGIH